MVFVIFDRVGCIHTIMFHAVSVISDRLSIVYRLVHILEHGSCAVHCLLLLLLVVTTCTER